MSTQRQTNLHDEINIFQMTTVLSQPLDCYANTGSQNANKLKTAHAMGITVTRQLH